MASNVQSNPEEAAKLQLRERCQSFIEKLTTREKKFSTIEIWNRISILAGSTAQRNNLFRLLLLSLSNAEAEGCLASFTGHRFVDDYLFEHTDGIQDGEFTELDPGAVMKAYPIWTLRMAFAVLENLWYLLKCFRDITDQDGTMVFRPISFEPQPLALPTEEVLKFIDANYAKEDEEKLVKVKGLKRERDAEIGLAKEHAKRARLDNPPLAQQPHLLPMGAGVNGQPGQMGYGFQSLNQSFTHSVPNVNVAPGNHNSFLGNAESENGIEHSNVMNQPQAQPIHQARPAQPMAQSLYQAQPMAHPVQPMAQPVEQAQPMAHPILQTQPMVQPIAQPVYQVQPTAHHFQPIYPTQLLPQGVDVNGYQGQTGYDVPNIDQNFTHSVSNVNVAPGNHNSFLGNAESENGIEHSNVMNQPQ
eukprot:983605_1